MELLEAILEANHRFSRGDQQARLRLEDASAGLPLVALTCIDPRLNHLLPDALGVAEEQFIWLRNAGNIITGPLSSTMRSLALACLIKNGREIAIIGHTDCLVGKTSILNLTDAMNRLGIGRDRLPENLVEYFGVFSSERQNVLKAVDFVRGSPLIGPKIPVHGLLLDLQTRRLEWLVNGYQALQTATSQFASTLRQAERVTTTLQDLPEFKIGTMEFPSTKIGELAEQATDFLKKIEAKSEEIEAAYRQLKDRPEERPRTVAGRFIEKVTETVKEKAAEFAEDVAEAHLLRRIDAAKRYIVIGNDQKRYGPVPGKLVQQWLADNRIDATTPIQSEGSDYWQTIGALPDPGPRGSLRLPPPITAAKQFKIKR